MSVNKKGLGRGLDALLGDFTAAPPEGVKEADIHLIDVNSNQPRKAFDEEKMRELAGSIARYGVVQPLIVRRNGERYTIVAGERRFRAARMAGLTAVPVLVKEFEDDEVLEVALIENIQRENLNPIEEAAAIRFLMQQHDLTQEEVALRLSRSRSAIANSLRLLSLEPAVQGFVRDGKLSAGHARALASVKDPHRQRAAAAQMIDRGMSVRDAEARVRAINEPEVVRAEKKLVHAKLPNELFAAQERLREHLGTRVTISGTERRGKLTIDYYSKDALEGLYDLLMSL